MAGTRDYQNIHGRRFGRGARPWLLIPKVLFVAVFLGGLVSLLVLGFLQPTPTTAAEWTAQLTIIRQAYRCVIVPALAGALLTGVALTIVHRGVLLRMRWLQVKLALIVAFVPTFHLFMAGRSLALQDAITRVDFAAATLLRKQLFRGTVATLAFAVAVILLGRLKPRLGQAYGRTFGQKREEPQE
ncbi:MAG TPA: hypothetical protein PK184_17340 [Phycisphaerae bacterium]|nr:hypothetical protein [Phycisphaerae bacterium]HPU34462.1 hypothetical protein [Phycisphaerae bacterium]